MIWHIAKKEILENLTTYRFTILTAMLVILMAVSIVVLYGDYENRLEDFNLNHPTGPSSNIMIPPTPLSVFAKGEDAHLGRLYYVKYSGIEVQAIEQSVNRLFSLFTTPDMLFIIKVMLSLIALLFSFDVITSEKEQGTLKLILTNGTNRFALLMGKLLGRFSLVTIPFALLFIAAAIAVSLLPNIPASADYWAKIFFFLLTSIIYIFAFITIGLLVSSLVHRSATSLALCLAVWVLLVFIVPETGMAISRTLAPVPPSETVEMQSRLALIRGIYERIHVDPGWTMTGHQRMIKELDDANSQLYESYRPKLLSQIQLTKWLVRISPAGALTFLLTDVANAGLFEEVRFKDALTNFAQRNAELINETKKGTLEDFHYSRSSLNEILSRAAITDLFIIIFSGVLLIALAMVSISEYDPR